MVLNSKLDIRASPRTGGFEIYATTRIRKGEWIWKETEEEHSIARDTKFLQNLPEDARKIYLSFAHKIGHDIYESLPEFDELPADEWHTVKQSRDKSKHMNHSCSPNAWFQHSAYGLTERCALMVAIRDIEEDEEVTYDYVMSEDDEELLIDFKCECGVPECRGRVTAMDWQLSVLQANYAGHFLKHVAMKIARYNFVERWNIQVMTSPTIGRYLATDRVIPRGALVMVLPPNRLQRGVEVASWNAVVQVDDDLFSASITEHDLDNFLAHSCDPNCDMIVRPDYRVDVVAIRDIPAGEAISFDYESTDEDMIYQNVDFSCNCGAKNCRGQITGKKYKDEALAQTEPNANETNEQVVLASLTAACVEASASSVVLNNEAVASNNTEAICDTR